MKYYLMGVFASAVMLYGMSLIYGVTGTHPARRDRPAARRQLRRPRPVVTLGIVFVLVGFGFKVSAVPFHTWAPDTYEGAPTPVTAFLSVASKAAGFVALLELIFVGFFGRDRRRTSPMMWVLAALTMTVGNLIALRQTNIVRMLAYSGDRPGRLILAPLAVAGTSAAVAPTPSGRRHLPVIYAAMNLGAFAVVIAVARKTRSAEIASFGRPVRVRARASPSP